MTVDQFKQTFRAIQNDAIRDNPNARGACQILHNDLGLGATPTDDAEELAAARTAELREQGLVDDDFTLEATDLDFTVEHAELHRMLEGIIAVTATMGITGDQVIAMALLIGRRMGMKEAAEMTGAIDFSDWGKTLPEALDADDGDQDD